MKLLIIEDDNNKALALTKVIEGLEKNINILVKHSYKSGINSIFNDSVDVILLDMSMPTFDIVPGETGGKPNPLAGRDILFRMERRGVKIPTIVVTQYESFDNVTLNELSEDLEIRFKGTYFGVIYYSASSDKWKKELEDKLGKINEAN